MKLGQLLFWILETQDFPTNAHLEPNLGMMGVQKKKCVLFPSLRLWHYSGLGSRLHVALLQNLLVFVSELSTH